MSSVMFESLQFQNLSFGFGDGENLIASCNFDFPMGRRLLFFGEANSGKSSLFRLFAGLLHPSEGNYRINGLVVSEMSFEEFLPYRLKMGFSFDLGGLLSNKTLFENLLLPIVYHNVYPLEEAQDRVRSLLAEFHLEKVAHQRPSMVSGSQRKLTCVLRALVHDPEWLLLDDPLTGLSDEASIRLAEKIADLESRRVVNQVWFSGGGHLAQLFKADHQIEMKNQKLHFGGSMSQTAAEVAS